MNQKKSLEAATVVAELGEVASCIKQKILGYPLMEI